MNESTNRGPTAARARRRAGGLLLALALAGGSAVCGKKGPPLPPLVHLPAPVEGFTVRRLGDTVFLQFTVPSKNQDNTSPANLAAVDVYGFTGALPQNDELVKYGTLVARVPVRRPPPPEEKKRDTKRGTKKEAAATPAPQRTVVVEPGYDQGAVVTITETLTPALLEPVVVKSKRAEPKPKVPPLPPVFLPTALLDDVATRTYVAVGVDHRGRRGAFSPRIAVPVVPAPAAPGAPTFSYDETTLTVTWPPPSDAPAAPEAPPAAPGEMTLPPSRSLAPLLAAEPVYDLYRQPTASEEAKPAGPGTPGAPATPPIPVPLNPKPLTVRMFALPVDLGVEQCFAVRVGRSFGRMVVASALSPIGCVTPRDTFPPAAPKGLSAVVSSGELSLAWEPNAESDLAGYLVLRGEAAGGPMQPLMKEPIAETNYVDRTVKPGVRYVYAVVAVDKAGNLSAQSNRIEETAR